MESGGIETVAFGWGARSSRTRPRGGAGALRNMPTRQLMIFMGRCADRHYDTRCLRMIPRITNMSAVLFHKSYCECVL